MHVAIAIGSNIGNRLDHLQFAVDKLSERVEITAVSSVYATAPVGGPEQDDFLNAVLVGETNQDPHDLLNFCHEIEAAALRVRKEHWGPRTLDVDLLAMGDQESSTETLQLPHPRAHERGFVLVPWSEIDPDFMLVNRGAISSLAAHVDVTGVDRADEFVLTIPPRSPHAH